MIDERKVFFTLLDEKNRLEAEYNRYLDDYNRAVFEDEKELVRIDKILALIANDAKNIDTAIRAIRQRTDIEVLTEWRKEYSNK